MVHGRGRALPVVPTAAFGRPRLRDPQPPFPFPGFQELIDPAIGGSLQTTVQVTAGGTNNTKGSWAEAISSTTANIYKIRLEFTTSTTSAQNCTILLDVGVGTAGNEVVIIPDILAGYVIGQTNQSRAYFVEFMVYIPAGSRIAYRSAAATAGRTVFVNMHTYTMDPVLAAPFRLPQTLTSYGVTSATSKGTAIPRPTDVATAINTKTPWATIATTTTDVQFISVSIGGNASSTQVAVNCLVDIGYGPNGSETIIIPNVPVITTAAEALYMPYNTVHQCDIRSGTLLKARIAADVNTANLDCVIHCTPRVGY